MIPYYMVTMGVDRPDRTYCHPQTSCMFFFGEEIPPNHCREAHQVWISPTWVAFHHPWSTLIGFHPKVGGWNPTCFSPHFLAPGSWPLHFFLQKMSQISPNQTLPLGIANPWCMDHPKDLFGGPSKGKRMSIHHPLGFKDGTPWKVLAYLQHILSPA